MLNDSPASYNIEHGRIQKPEWLGYIACEEV